MILVTAFGKFRRKLRQRSRIKGFVTVEKRKKKKKKKKELSQS
jgi:hypothetical protein